MGLNELLGTVMDTIELDFGGAARKITRSGKTQPPKFSLHNAVWLLATR